MNPKHPAKKYLDRIVEWLSANWDDWAFVTPGNHEAMWMLLKTLKAEGVVRSLANSHSRVALAIRVVRERKSHISEL